MKSPSINSKNVDNQENPDNFFKDYPIDTQEKRFNQLKPTPNHDKPTKRRALRLILTTIILIILGLGGFLFIRTSSLADKIFVGNNTSLYGKISDLITSQSGSKLIGEQTGQINLLLLGIGGVGHDGPYLSDTIILAQLKPQTQQTTLISIPRDYLVNTKALGQRKINAVFSETFSATKDWEQSGEATLAVVEKMSGLEIPYFAVLDFAGFKKTIDLLEGIEVNIERSFTDYTYPDSNNGYLPPISFKQGLELMGGERALIYARSRHASGSEGSDFARSVRQQQIIQASKSKLTSLNLISDVKKINELFTIIGEHFHTNLTPGEVIRLHNVSKNITGDNILSLSLDPATSIICPKTLENNGAFVLVLCEGKTARDLENFFQQSFDTNQITSEKATVWIADSTTTGKLYNKVATELKNNGITVNKILYNGKPIAQNVIYSVTNKTATIDFLKDRLKASEVSLAPPGIKIDPKKVDIIIILGEEPQ